MEVKIKTNEPPSPAEARMLLTWIGEHYPGLVLTEEAPAPTPEEMVDAGDLPGVQTEIDYNAETGEIISARCGGCQTPLKAYDDDCVNPDCPYILDDEIEDGEDGDE